MILTCNLQIPARHRPLRRILAIMLIVAMLAIPMLASGCSDDPESKVSVADFGTYGSDLAEKLASSYPYRSPGSTQERSAGDLLIKSFEELGYEPVVTEFSFKGTDGKTYKSRNIAVRIEGTGFVKTDESGKTQDLESQVIVGAHYDTPISAAQAAAAKETAETTAKTSESLTLSGEVAEPTLEDYDGIHDNASGIGTLLTLAKQLKSGRYGYDIVLVAFGAGNAKLAGSKNFVSKMAKAEIAATDAMYCLDSIYAGDKVYAHSGRNSLKANYLKDYEKRRKLYEVTDVFYEYELYTNNNFMLYTNQSSFDVKWDDLKTAVYYREWTTNDSDYVPFDNLGVPIVFFESYDYDEKTLDEMTESQNPAFGSEKGMIRGTKYDSAKFLDQILNPTRSTVSTADTADKTTKTIDQLTKRINNIAFIIQEAIRKGMAGATAR